MKKYISYIVAVVSLALGTSSCNREIIQDNGFGYLGVSLERDMSSDMVTRAGGDELVFALDVLDASGNVVETRDDCLTTVEDPIKLKVGRYDLVARSGENLNAAFENPYYEGRTAESFKIVPGRVKSVDLTCSLANTIFSAEFSDEFRDFVDYEISVTNGIGGKLVFSNSPEAGNSSEAAFGAKAYFAVTGSLTYEIYLKNTDGGVWRQSEIITGVKAKQHYHLLMTLGEDDTDTGAIVIKVSLNNEWVDGDHNLNLDFSKKNPPAIETDEAFGAVSGEEVMVPFGDGSQRDLIFSAGYGFASLKMEHSNVTLLENGLPRSVEFVGASEELLTSLGNLGMTFDITPSGAPSSQTTRLVAGLGGFLSSLPMGKYEIDFTLKDNKDETAMFYLDVLVDQDDVETLSAGAGWTAFAQLNGKLNKSEKKDAATFMYKKVADSEWTEISPSKIEFDLTGSTYSTLVYGLEPSTEYEFRAVSDGDKETKSVRFTTASYQTLHNLNFDSWSDGNKYFPNADGYTVWDSANSTGIVKTTTPVDDAVSGKAARLESMNVAMFAAGNIFTGDFLKAVLVGGVGATLDWGTPFTGRPLALRGYYKYSPKTIDYASDTHSHLKGQGDECQILMCLTDWDKPFTVNTAAGDFVDFDNDEGIIAYGVFNTPNPSSEYIQFTIPLVYRDNARIPTYAIVAAASSRYGDYFTGGKGSVLWLDEFEFVYDPAELTEEEFNTVFSRVKPF